jgi:hypothetical protein
MYYAVNYTLNRQKDYKRLWELLKQAPDWVRVSESYWVLETQNTKMDWRVAIKSVVDGDDEYTIVDITSEVLAEEVYGTMKPEVLAWFKKKARKAPAPTTLPTFAKPGRPNRLSGLLAGY